MDQFCNNCNIICLPGLQIPVQAYTTNQSIVPNGLIRSEQFRKAWCVHLNNLTEHCKGETIIYFEYRTLHVPVSYFAKFFLLPVVLECIFIFSMLAKLVKWMASRDQHDTPVLICKKVMNIPVCIDCICICTTNTKVSPLLNSASPINTLAIRLGCRRWPKKWMFQSYLYRHFKYIIHSTAIFI